VKRSSLILVVVVLALLLAACGGQATPTQAPAGQAPAEEAKTYRIATDATWPPFEYIDESSKAIVGFDIDLMTAIAEKANIKVEFVNVSWDPLLTGVSECQYDAAISAMTITEERKKTMLFSEPYLNAGQIVIVNKNNTDIKSKDDLKGKIAGAQIGTTGAMEIEKIEGATLRSYDTVDLAFLDLANGQIDAVVADYPTAMAFVAKNADKIMPVGEVFTDEYYGIAVCQKNTELLEKLNQGLAAVKAEGLIEKLDAKWLKGETQ